MSFISLTYIYRIVETGVVNLRYMYLLSFIVLLMIQVVTKWHSDKWVLAFVMFSLWLYVHFRVFGTSLYRFGHPSDHVLTTVEIVIMTIPSSSRNDLVESWVNTHMGMYPYTIESNHTQFAQSIQDQEFPSTITPKVRNYTRRFVDFLETYHTHSTSDWILFLEDDAIPINLDSFANLIHSLSYVGSSYDFINLDVRSLMMDFLPNSMIGTVGMMIQKYSMRDIADYIVYTYKHYPYTSLLGYDTILGKAVNEGALKGTCVPSLKEQNDVVSTLDYGRNMKREQSDQSVIKYSTWFASILVFTIVELKLTNKRLRPIHLDQFKS